ncbi:MAG TPA: adenosylcobinamide-GDP ribazoletransferase [Gaiellaceae bacterium]|jgi:adenosylcobinamide-GDP ribazoletransferase
MPVASELRALVAALAFLTRIPVGRFVELGGDDVARAGALFPLVGAGIGAAVGGVAAALAGPLPTLAAAGIALAAGALLTGALHLDALADTADALGATSRERALEIMRDHAIGAYGTVALVLDLLVKAAALAALASHNRALGAAVAAGAVSRAVPVALGAALPYARPAGGVGASIAGGAAWRGAVACVVALAFAVVAGRDGLLAAAVAAALAVALGLAFRAWLGGVTGDTLGAAVELTELAALLAFVALVA